MSTKITQSSAPTADVEQGMALVEKAQQLAGHFPNEEALGLARRVLEGTMTGDEARAQVAAKFGIPVKQR
ncbi:hypothetical protein [Clavibacter michiganensis]|uniref:Antitoxin VbhA domain-containing protein n=1 Tax=Clavibacter michiganensis subsp. insidiosus TaxID=33014 RepID=A0A0D5CMI0_9MICO|nr:hypothetical protein [Clavibacter michiganensis]AJW80470.1 hypothetical protein VO01_07595 [Clavibacter michiganensis subsp. insidiosus]OQJ61295.1 hypothetical protein B5P21_08640 [Clavibacter michiganensis subsp. insidiosus]RII88430.1 hypothetical protein DZF92_03120 [Clavibacter michiganensis subsp. insidiosus]RIJ44384.1 hypothetical protein DZF93_03035 [Clavibacter michiganensis subsp. insidiosus]RMC89011.1 hypothetical protein CmiCFBP2404_00845 [Clavibacter michiganensis subsp. insidios